MEPRGTTKPYAVLGHPIGHTLSPPLHNAAFAELGWDAIYLAFDVVPERVMEVLEAMRSMGFGGVNLTVPHKEVAFQGIAELDISAQQAGAVNTVQFTDHGLRGYNTDGVGLLRALEESFGGTVAGERIVMLGSGGAARATALTCAREGAGSVTVVARNQPAALALVEELKAVAPAMPAGAVCEPSHQPEAIRGGTLVIQGTSVGLRREDAPLFPASAFRTGQRFYDLIYSFPETSTMKAAREAGAEVANGLNMLLHQGVRSFEIWTGKTPPVETMREALMKAAAA